MIIESHSPANGLRAILDEAGVDSISADGGLSKPLLTDFYIEPLVMAERLERTGFAVQDSDQANKDKSLATEGLLMPYKLNTSVKYSL